LRRWPLLLLATLEAALVLGVIYFEPTYCVRGRLWGEAFFEGKPTSFWREELERSDVRIHVVHRLRNDWCGSMPPRRFRVYSREATWFERQREHWLPVADEERFMHLGEAFHGPKLIQGDASAVPVLEALLDDPSPKVCMFARIGLKLEVVLPSDDD
jgi:hypothetical protein